MNFAGIIQNLKVHYRQKVLKAVLSKMESESSAYDLAKKMTVLDAILWVKAAIKEIKTETVCNCFKKCGFPIAEGEEIVVDVDGETEVQNLIDLTWGTRFLAEDYINIDQNLETESYSTDVADLIENSEKEEIEESSDEEEQVEEYDISPSEAAEDIEKLKKYFLQNKDTVGFEYTANLKMHFENCQSKKKKKQTFITQYFK